MGDMSIIVYLDSILDDEFGCWLNQFLFKKFLIYDYFPFVYQCKGMIIHIFELNS